MPATVHQSARRYPKKFDEPEDGLCELGDEEGDGEASVENTEEDEEVEQEEEEQEDRDEEDEEQLDEDDQPVQKSLVRLATEVSDCHKEIVKCDRRAVKLALQAGELLLEAKRRLGHGRWSEWLSKCVELGERQVQRYMRLVRCRSQLDALDPDWVSTSSLAEALALIADPRQEAAAEQEATDAETDEEKPSGDEEAQDEGESTSDEDEEQDEAEEDRTEEGDQEDEDEEQGEDPARRRAQYRAACKAHTERCSRFDEFRRAGYLKFGRNGKASAAFATIADALVKAARREARALVSRDMRTDGFDGEYVAMELAARLLKDGDVKMLFAPAKP
jgi:hypothetical protein